MVASLESQSIEVSKSKGTGRRRNLPERDYNWLSLLRRSKKLAPYLVWQIAALLMVEVILSLAGLGEEEIFKLDKQIGTVHMVDKAVTWRKEGYARSYLYASGLREPAAVAKAPGIYRIVLLGDSQTEAMQVGLDKSFGKILQAKLSRKLGQPVEVLNFGVSGYSTVQELLLMRRQVFAYAPDLILVGYNARDMFENWAVPDSAITNVRPIALKLPKQKVVIDPSAVSSWMKSPRGKFLNSIEFLRTHSRIWGLIASFESDASAHNPIYKTVANFFTAPGSVIKQFKAEVAQPDYFKKLKGGLKKEMDQAWQAQIAQWDFAKVMAATTVAAPAAATPVVSSVRASEKAPVKAPPESKPLSDSDRLFHDVIANTMNALLQEFKSDSVKHNCKLMVVGLPSRATLLPIAGMDASTLGMNYEGELALVEKQCRQNQIPYIDAQAPAVNFTGEQIERLFYTAHLNNEGQVYVADTIESAVADTMKTGL